MRNQVFIYFVVLPKTFTHALFLRVKTEKNRSRDSCYFSSLFVALMVVGHQNQRFCVDSLNLCWTCRTRWRTQFEDLKVQGLQLLLSWCFILFVDEQFIKETNRETNNHICPVHKLWNNRDLFVVTGFCFFSLVLQPGCSFLQSLSSAKMCDTGSSWWLFQTISNLEWFSFELLLHKQCCQNSAYWLGAGTFAWQHYLIVYSGDTGKSFQWQKNSKSKNKHQCAPAGPVLFQSDSKSVWTQNNYNIWCFTTSTVSTGWYLGIFNFKMNRSKLK